MIRNSPDKLVYKPTITNKLREQIANSCKNILNKQNPLTYLEIGIDKGFTLLSLIDCFDNLVGIDIDPARVDYAKNLAKTNLNTNELSKLNIIQGTSVDIPVQAYDVVLVDAAHDYDNVKLDYKNVIEKNENEEFVVFFHDYGLSGAGVKKFINETFDKSKYFYCGLEKDWNPHGSHVTDWEAVYVVVNNKEKQ